MSTTVEELTAHVARLEEDMSGIRDLRLDVAYRSRHTGLSLVHTDTQAIRADIADVKQLGEVLSPPTKPGAPLGGERR
jgi:hypothetical protein